MTELLKIYFSMRLRCVWRTCKSLGVFVTVFMLLALLIISIIIKYTPTNYIAFLYLVLTISWHINRKDYAFLLSLSTRKHVRVLFLMEYSLYAFPFICLLLARERWWVGIVLLPFAAIIPFIPRKNANFSLPTFPLLAQGSFEYQRAGRMILPLFILLLTVGSIGVYVNNYQLVRVVSIATVAITGMFLCIDTNAYYMFNYKSVNRYLKLRVIFAIRNSLVMLFPFSLCLFAAKPAYSQIFLCIFYLMNASLLFFQLEMARIKCNNNELMYLFAFCGLFFMFIATLFIPITTIASGIVAGILAIWIYSNLKKYGL